MRMCARVSDRAAHGEREKGREGPAVTSGSEFTNPTMGKTSLFNIN